MPGSSSTSSGACRPARVTNSTTEAAVRAAASIADKAIVENRAVGLTVNSHRQSILPSDRGARQHLKIMQLLAAVDADGPSALGESLLGSLGRVRRGMTVVVITASLERDWVRPLASLRTRGIGCVVVWLDASAYARYGVPLKAGQQPAELDEMTAQRTRALRHALAEYDLRTVVVTPGRLLGEVLVQ